MFPIGLPWTQLGPGAVKQAAVIIESDQTSRGGTDTIQTQVTQFRSVSPLKLEKGHYGRTTVLWVRIKSWSNCGQAQYVLPVAIAI